MSAPPFPFWDQTEEHHHEHHPPQDGPDGFSGSPAPMSYQPSEQLVASEIPRESDAGDLTSDIPHESNGGNLKIELNGLLPPVQPGESGEGLPYAPINWPNPGDIWTWRVGKRYQSSGYFQDRFVYPPKHLPKPASGVKFFGSKPALERYLRFAFPNADVDAFFASFSWKVPVRVPSPTKVELPFPAPVEGNPQDKLLKTEEVAEGELPRSSRRTRKQNVVTTSLNEEDLLHDETEIIGLDGTEEKSRPTPRKRKQNTVKSASPVEKTRRSSRKTTSMTENPPSKKRAKGSQQSAIVIPEDFDNYLDTLEDILTKPLNGTPASNSVDNGSPVAGDEMAEARRRLSFLLAADFPSLISSRYFSEVVTIASKLRKDPTMTAEQLVKLKLIEEMPSFSEIFLESTDTIKQVDKFFATLEKNKTKVTSLKSEYNELKEKADQLQTNVDSSLLAVQDIDNQIAQLEFQRAELITTIESNKAAKVEVTDAQKMVANAIPSVVHDIQVANTKIPEWNLKKANAVKRKEEILAKFASLQEFSL